MIHSKQTRLSTMRMHPRMRPNQNRNRGKRVRVASMPCENRESGENPERSCRRKERARLLRNTSATGCLLTVRTPEAGVCAEGKPTSGKASRVMTAKPEYLPVFSPPERACNSFTVNEGMIAMERAVSTIACSGNTCASVGRIGALFVAVFPAAGAAPSADGARMGAGCASRRRTAWQGLQGNNR